MHAALLLFLLSGSAIQDKPSEPKTAAAKPPTAEQLAAITGRGKLLAEYDQAAWHASDVLQKLNPPAENVGRYIAHKTEKGWVVAFGRLDTKQDRFLVAYEATQGKKPEDFDVKSVEPPSADAGFNRSAAKAVDTVLKEFVENFKGEQRPYNVAILPAEKSELWVYLVPAPTKAGVWPLGGDVRYRVSKDGSRIIDKRQLHNSVIEIPAPEKGPDNQLAAGMHTHVLDDIPEDTDVFHVLQRKPAVPETLSSRLRSRARSSTSGQRRKFSKSSCPIRFRSPFCEGVARSRSRKPSSASSPG
jgi:hypothetical protein